MPRFTLTQLFLATAWAAFVFALATSDRMGKAYTRINAVEFCPDGKRLAVVRLDACSSHANPFVANVARTITLIDVESATVASIIKRDFSPSEGGSRLDLWGAAYDPIGFNSNGSCLFFQSFIERDIFRLDLSTKDLATFHGNASQNDTVDFALSPDRTVMAATTTYQGVVLLDTANGKHLFGNPGLAAIYPSAVGLSANNEWVAVRTEDGLRLLEASTLKIGPAIGCTGPFAFAPNDPQIAVAENKVVRVHDLDTRATNEFTLEHKARQIEFTEDGKRLVVLLGNSLLLLVVKSGEELSRLEYANETASFCCSPAGNLVALGSGVDGLVTLWDPTTGLTRTVHAPGQNGYPWTLPTAIFAIGIVGWYAVDKWRNRRKAPVEKVVFQSDEKRLSEKQ